MQYGSPPVRVDSSSPVPQPSPLSKLKRTFSETEESEEERSIPVPLKRRKDPTLRPLTTNTTPPEELLRKFQVIRHPFRHRYTSLPDNHIRILVIKRGTRDDPLELRLEAQSLESSHRHDNRYEALSYEWGPGFPRYEVTVDDTTKTLTEQLDELRESNLGQRERALTMLRLLVRTYLVERSKKTPFLSRKTLKPKRLVRENLYNALLLFRSKKKDVRMWVDAMSIFRTNRDSVFKVLNEPPLQYSTILEVFDGLGATAMVRQTFHLLRRDLKGNVLERRKTLEEVVSEFTSFESSDPRDTIYAVLSIARPQVAGSNATEYIQPNYEKSLLDVYVDFVRYSIECSEGNLDIICRHWAPVKTVLRASASEFNENNRLIKNYVEVE